MDKNMLMSIKPFNLTKRETEIMQYWIKDYSCPEIGMQLGISPNTVKSHLSRINMKLHVNSKASLILKMMEVTSVHEMPFPRKAIIIEEHFERNEGGI